jgi:hypothetical protein
MALTIDATAGGTSANCYCTLAEAQAYHESRLHSLTTWEAADDGEEKTPALIWATRLLDDLVNWIGTKTSDDQALRWPRSYVYDIDGVQIGADTVPNWLKEATAEFAYHLLGEDLTIDSNRDLMGFEQVKIGPLMVKVDKYTQKPVLPKSVALMIRRYTPWGRKRRALERM